MKYFLIILLLSFGALSSVGQTNPADSITSWLTVHGQTTVISQTKLSFSAKYSGPNSLTTDKETQSTVTSTLFAGARLWKNASFYVDPEISGGSGLDGALGVPDALNGESYRVGDPSPSVSLARLYFQQLFPIGKEISYQQDDINQLPGILPSRYISLVVGKISISDFFDDNQYSHDPRTQFVAWSLMSSGAWDYPANTKGYTPSVVVQYVTIKDELHGAISLMPKEANGQDMNWDISKVYSLTLEYTHRHRWLFHRNGAIRGLVFFTRANMGNYNESIAMNPSMPDIVADEKNGRTKYGFSFNAEQELNSYMGAFTRVSWNDGNNQTWAFTEIDRSWQLGLSFNGIKWKRANDNVGIAYVISGISQPHRNYLKAGGDGFMLGDGNLNYVPENLIETYYSFAVNKNLFISGTYQLLINPGYNFDRKGPVNIFSVRVHTEF
jgi:high affinity Mn2+ porin